jgi:pimeloyl-ACP methyl ester carboxylesterase/predicted glycosyltransferase
MRAEEPVETGFVERDGVRVGYEVYGRSGPVLLLLPCWVIVHARQWKAQIADLAVDHRLVVVDGRGNGRSDRPQGSDAYTARQYAADALAVMDRLGIDDCTVLGFSMGGVIAALVAEARPEAVRRLLLIAPTGPKSPELRQAQKRAFLEARPSYDDWLKYNAHFWREDYRGFVEFFFSRMFCEPHSTKQREDAVAWGLETTPEVLIDTVLGRLGEDLDVAALYAGVRQPALVVHGDRDEIVPLAVGREVAAACGAELVVMPGSGHGPHIRHPAAVNRLIRSFVGASAPAAAPAPRRARAGPRVLYLSSPIGLGHARRDLAIAGALRTARPDLTIDWLAQDPVTRLLARRGERLHPASVRLASESGHIEEEAGEHDLHVFEALRRMDEILVRNFRVVQDALESDRYDLLIADEAWEVDHFWHEHPELKRAPLVWMTDFVGFAPVPEAGERDVHLSADYNAEMVEHVEQHPAVRDRAIFVGSPGDIVDDRLGPDLPGRREWVEQRFAFSGYILGDDVPSPDDCDELRRRFGFAADEKVCIVAVGGSGVGAPLIRRILAAIPLARAQRPELRTIVVGGPRLGEHLFARIPGVEFRGFEPELPAMLAACDLALVQGGLSTCMELAAVRTPFIYFPLQRHFEQTVHVRRRLEAYGAGRALAYSEAEPSMIAQAMDEALGAPSAWREVERDGAVRAAGLISELL